MTKEKRGRLNLLLIRQAYLVRKLHSGNLEALTDLKSVQKEVNDWYDNENEKIKFQAKMDNITENEIVKIYHHEIHQRLIKKLETSSNESVTGHWECARYLEKSVEDILCGAPNINTQAQDILLEEVETVFTAKDNEMLLKNPQGMSCGRY